MCYHKINGSKGSNSTRIWGRI